MQDALPDAFSFREGPVVIPAGQQIQGISQQGGQGQVRCSCGAVDEPGSPLVHQVQVDLCVGVEPQGAFVRGHQVNAGAAQPPERRAKVAGGAAFVA